MTSQAVENTIIQTQYRARSLVVHREIGLTVSVFLVHLLFNLLAVSEIVDVALARLIVSTLVVLVLPGYHFHVLLFPHRNDLSGLERIVLTLGTSIASAPLMAFILDSLPLTRIDTPSILLFQGLYIALLAIGSWLRRIRLPEDERFLLAIPMQMDVFHWLGQQAPVTRVLLVSLSLTFAAAATGLLLTLLLPGTSHQFTEFFVLGSEGQAENYPRDLRSSESIALILGVVNYEEHQQQYQIVVMHGNKVLTETAPFSIVHGERSVQAIRFSIDETGTGQPISFLLFRDGQQTPYRRLHLWMDTLSENSARS
jgi:uncharacterized membrane protein